MCLGGDLKEFLTTLDGVYDTLQNQDNQEGDQDSEAFICTSIDEERLQLDYMTERPAAALLLVGSLRAIARILYSTEAEIKLTQSSHDKRHHT